MPQTETDLKKAEEIASSEGGPNKPKADALRQQSHASDKMENELEMQKEHKHKVHSADEVAGRKDKGSMTGLLEKVTGDPGSKGK